MKRTCVICNNQFETNYQHKKTCGDSCSLTLREINKRKGNKERTIAWRKANPDKVKEQKKRSDKNYRLSGKAKEWRDRNKDKCKAKEESWRKRNPLKKQACNKRRYINIDKIGIASESEIADRMSLFSGCCYCGSKNRLSLEHLIPISNGGNNMPFNLFGACLKCNCSKNNKPFVEWFRKQSFYDPEREYNILNFFLAG